MTDLPLLTAAQAASADQAARERHGVPERVLMENAGRAAALILHRLYPRGRIVGVAGSGNNGGDALVMLRVLQAWGRDVTLIAAGSRPPDAALAHGATVPLVSSDRDGQRALAAADILVDGMLGTGAAGAPRGRIADWIPWINATSRPVVALDLPSGVDATSGAVAHDAIRADVTICFGWPKLGLLLQPARQHCGRLIAVEMGFPDCAEPDAWAITADFVRRRLRPRTVDAHKGSAGRLLVAAGSRGMAGAAGLAAEAAFRAGVGLVRVASVSENREILQTLVPEATFLDADSLGTDDIEPMHALVAGPGLGMDAGARDRLHRLTGLTPGLSTLLDADALNLLADEAGALRRLGETRPLVITPHARELSRLTGEPLDRILDDTPGAARAAAAAFRCVVLLKRQPSLVAAPDGALYVNTVGSSDTAVAGMGDQLAGTIGALLAGGLEPVDAAAAGLFLSGRAADLAGRGRSLMPRDVSDRLGDALDGVLGDATPDAALASDLADLPFLLFDQPTRH